MKMKTQKLIYGSPRVLVTQVELEESLAQVAISVSARFIDWEEGEVLGDEPDEGGDVYLTY